MNRNALTTILHHATVAMLSAGGPFAATIATPAPAAAWSFIIEESTDYTGNGCPNTDLNTVTASLRDVLIAVGNTGQRFVNAQAYPQDFWEQCSASYGTSGLDRWYGDDRLLAVFAGHGDIGKVQFGYQKLGACDVQFANNMRLGAMAGARTGYAMYITSCTLNVNSIPSAANWQWLRQQFGFHDSPSVPDNAAFSFFASQIVYGWKNASAWLNTMEEDMSGDEENSPIVITHGTSVANAAYVRDNASLGQNLIVSARGGGPSCGNGPPVFHYNYVIRNNGGC